MNADDGTSTSDRQLAQAVLRAREERAFRTLYRRHTPRVYQLALRLLGGDVREAEDAVQETWIRGLEGLAGFRWESAFGTWLSGIAIHVSRDALRRRQRGREHLWEPTFDPPAPELPLGERIDLERAIAALPDGYRAVLVLHDVEGMQHEEIGQALEISTGTSKSQLHRARRALRTLLAPADEELTR